MPKFLSPTGNAEVWSEKPNGYFTQEEWDEQHTVVIPVPTTEELAKQVRTERDTRLTACDWTQLPDAPLSTDAQEAWRDYRQALRDMPTQDGFPWDGGAEETPWPVTPSETVDA